MNLSLRSSASELHQAWLGEVHVDFSAHALTRLGHTHRLTPKACAVLRELTWRENRVVRRDDLLGLVWPDSFPTDDVLTRAIRELRAALDVDARAPSLIETIPRVGYRLNAVVRLAPPSTGDVRAVPTDRATNDAEARSSDGASEASAAAASSVTTHDTSATPRRARRHAGWWIVPALAGLFAIAWGAAPWIAKLRSAKDEASRRTDAASHDPNARNHELVALTADPGTEYFPAISPDGALIAYVGTEPGKYDAALQVKSRDPGARAVTLVPAAHHSFMAHPIWSPDGTRIAYAQISEAGCELRAVPVTGGTPRAIAPCNANVMDAFDWSAASDALYLSEARDDEGAGARALATIDLATGKRTPLTYAPRAVGDVDLYPRVSPDGRWLAFRRGVRPYADIWVMPIDGGQARRVARLGSSQNGMAWLPDSTGLIVSSDHGGPQALHRVDVNDGSVIPLGIDNAHSPAVARNAGYVVFHRDLELAQLVAFDLDARGHVGAGRVIAPASRSDFAASLSRGGQRLAFVSDRSGTPQVWVYDFERAQTTMLTRLVEATPDFLEWSPDERHLLYVRRGRGSSELVRVDRDSGREQVLNHAGERIRFGSYGQDGETIFYAADRGDGWKLWRMRADGGGATPLGVAGLDPRQHPGDARVYYNKLSWRGLYRIDPEQGREEVVTNLVSYLSHGAYRVHGDRLWLYKRIDADRGVLSSRPAEGGLAADAELRDETTLTLDGGHPLPMASIDAGVTHIVVNMITRDGADVYVATLAPPTTP